MKSELLMRNLAQYPIRNSEVVRALTLALERLNHEDIGMGDTQMAALRVALEDYQGRDPNASANPAEHENTGVPEVVSSVG
jgi:hypothetical protein